MTRQAILSHLQKYQISTLNGYSNIVSASSSVPSLHQGMNSGLFIFVDKVFGEKRLVKKKLNE